MNTFHLNVIDQSHLSEMYSDILNVTDKICGPFSCLGYLSKIDRDLSSTNICADFMQMKHHLTSILTALSY